jgi:hypothetical protein
MAIFGIVGLPAHGYFGYLDILGIKPKNMFGKNKKEKEPEIKEEGPIDIIVHNMPNSTPVVSKNNSSTQAGGFYVSQRNGGDNHFKAGLIIVFLGILTALVLLYLGYRFMIMPIIENQNKAVVINQADIVEEDNLNNASNNENILSLKNASSTQLKEGEGKELFVDVATTSQEATSVEEITTSTSTEETVANHLTDSDGDGLYDQEESVVGSDPLSIDTDGDVYNDYEEVKNGYDPVGKDLLAGSRYFTSYDNSTFYYGFYLPSSWPVKSLAGDSTTIIDLPDSSLIQISAQENVGEETILAWYNYAFPNDTVTYDRLLKGKDWEGIKSANGQNIYLTDERRSEILIISYVSADGRLPAYPNIFNFIVSSLSFLAYD